LYYDISDSDIGIHTSAANWETNWAQAPAAGWTSLRGVLTHEIGHGVFLVDLNCSSPDTMCGQMSDGSGAGSAWEKASLTSDDIWSANYVYLP
jgi:hypothetical protein